MNLLEYINKFGTFTFEEKPFSDVDASVLSMLSYGKFEEYVPSITERKPGKLLKDFSLEELCKISEINTLGEDIKSIFFLVKESKRYQNILVENSMSISDIEALEQFAAFTFVIPYVGLFVSFRGTDGTTIGWKENLSILCREQTLSQLDSIEYLNLLSKIYPNESFIISGHSKGGNDVLFSLFYSDGVIFNKIKKAYSFDGFGFRTKQFRTILDYDKRVNKLVQIVPDKSMIGELFYTPLKYKIVESDADGMATHLPLYWCINESGEFIIAPRRTFKSRFLHRVVKKCSQNSTKYSLMVFTDIIISGLGIEGYFDVSNHPVKRVLKYMKNKSFNERMSFVWLCIQFGFYSFTSFFYYLWAQIKSLFKQKNKDRSNH